jgi:O-antigen/teichoic acid export membrane protein/SAM-dependent methyltransferase
MIACGDGPGESKEELESPLFAERLRLTRDGLANAVVYVMMSVAGMVIVPMLLSRLRAEVYGFWIAAVAVQSAGAFLGGGIGRGVAREVAAGNTSQMCGFAVAASNAYFAIGVIGALIIAAAGAPLAVALHVSAQSVPVARLIFCLVGIGFFGDQMQSLGMEILTGLRRFLTINAILGFSAILRTVGIIVALEAGGSIVAVATWYVLMCVATGAVTYTVALSLAPQFRPQFVRLQVSQIRNQFEFSLVSQIAAGCTSVLWRVAPFMIGILRGAAAIVPYEVGQKFPMAVFSISWQAADVLFPAASEYHSSRQEEHSRQLLEGGTRSVLFFVLPICVALWILAPNLLTTWVGGGYSAAVWVLRFTTLAVLADSLSATSVQLIWGQGRVEWVLKLTAISIVIALVAGCALTWRIGVPGMAAGVALGVGVSSVGFILLAAHLCRFSPRQVILTTLIDLSLPVLLAGGILLLLASLCTLQGWLVLVCAAVIYFVLYSVAFYFMGAQSVEKKIARGVVVSLNGSLYSFYRKVRRVLERVPLFRLLILYAVEIKNTLLESSERGRVAVQRRFSASEDPYGFARELEQFRFKRALELLNLANNESVFPRALEIGCAEGMFTEMLAPRCGALVAVDLSSIAVARAKRRCAQFPNIEFAEWDVRQDRLDGVFDLIVATGVLEYISRPSVLKNARERITSALRPGGYLLLGNTITERGIEHTWIGKKLIRGALINDYFADDARYETIATSIDECVCLFAHILLQRRRG